MKEKTKNQSEAMEMDKLKFQITKPSEEMQAVAKRKIDMKTKPLGSLGRLEDLAVQACMVQNTLTPNLQNKAAFVFAADHGIAEEGVSAFPQEVTKQMVLNFINKGAAINVLCEHNGIDISVIDMGVKGELAPFEELISSKINHGTKSFARTSAMHPGEAEKAIKAGSKIFRMKTKSKPIDMIGLGEMGIANTTSATAIISCITRKPVDECTGRGTGIDDQGLAHKIEVIQKALEYHKPDCTDAIDILSKVGGYEIAGMTGAALEAASSGCIVVLDGLISTAAGLLAYLINPNVREYFVSGHKSIEKGHIAALETLDLKPVLDLDFRLGEGTGAALTMNIVDAACKVMCNMASFEEAGVSNKSS